jgi:ketosteroid isomerase-like protein
MIKTVTELLSSAYDAFNRRDIDGALAAMHPDVEWANGMESGFVHGHEAVREYWTRQWRMIDPHVEPISFNQEPHGPVAVTVHQVVRDLSGKITVDHLVTHGYSIRDGLVCRMEIGDSP